MGEARSDGGANNPQAVVATSAPNLQKAVESTIPTLAGLLLGFIGALFVAAAVTDVSSMNSALQIKLFIFTEETLTIPVERRYFVMLASAVAALCFYKSIVACVLSQMAYYDKSSGSQDAPAPTNLEDPNTKLQWEAVIKGWEADRKKHANRGLAYYNYGQQFLLLPLVFLLPPGLLSAALLVWLISWFFFLRRLRRQ